MNAHDTKTITFEISNREAGAVLVALANAFLPLCDRQLDQCYVQIRTAIAALGDPEALVAAYGMNNYDLHLRCGTVHQIIDQAEFDLALLRYRRTKQDLMPILAYVHHWNGKGENPLHQLTAEESDAYVAAGDSLDFIDV